MTDVLVMGGGVVGLSTALRLALDTDYKVSVYSASFTEITSSYAGAYWWPPPAALLGDNLPTWALESLEFLRSQPADSGIAQRKIVGLTEEPWTIPDWYKQIPTFRQASAGEINAPFKHGLVIESAPVIDPAAYLKWLRHRLSALGVTLQVNKLSTLDQALELCPIVFNCTGLGAQELCQDSDLHPVSGQLVKLSKRKVDQVTFTGNQLRRTTYIVPHSSCTILGGTYFDNDWQTEPDQTETRLIIERCNQLCPSLNASESDVIACTRALRPVRSSVRVEMEKREKGVVVHNYGHGRSGFSLAYGSADTAVKLIAGL